MPRVILIGGAPLTGKSTVAAQLAAQLGYACISTDDLGAAVAEACLVAGSVKVSGRSR